MKEKPISTIDRIRQLLKNEEIASITLVHSRAQLRIEYKKLLKEWHDVEIGDLIMTGGRKARIVGIHDMHIDERGKLPTLLVSIQGASAKRASLASSWAKMEQAEEEDNG